MDTNQSLLDKNSFIKKHLDNDVASIALMKAPVDGWDMKAIASTIHGYQKIKAKLPSWYQTENLAFGSSVNLEQASSELTAQFKNTLLSKFNLKSGIDLCAGLGVDSFFISEPMLGWTVVEEDKALLERTAHNFKQLRPNTTCTFICDTAENFLKNLGSDVYVDLIYLDPDRRPDSTNKRVFRFEDCTPNLVALLPNIAQKCRFLLVKSSPMMDINEGLKLLPSAQVYVVSVKNEVKEIVWLVDNNAKNWTAATIQTIELSYDWESLLSTIPIEKNAIGLLNTVPEGPGYFILPSAGIMKAGLHKHLAFKQNWKAFNHSSHIYFSQERPAKNLPIRVFEKIAVLPTNPKQFKKYGLKSAQVITKNDPLKPAELLKKYKISEGGEDFILSFTDNNAKRVMIHARRVY